MTLDIACDVLIKVANGKPVNASDAKAALKCHQGILKDVQFYKKHYMQYAETNRELDPQGGREQYFSPKGSEEIVHLREIEQQKRQLNNDLFQHKREISELKNRLSAIAGQQMADNNPDITDLSDPNRPILLGEKFRQVYDDDWTHAFDDLETINRKDTDIIDLLAQLLIEVDEFCSRTEQEQMSKLLDSTRHIIDSPTVFNRQATDAPLKLTSSQEVILTRIMKDLRKSLSLASVQGLFQVFYNEYYIPKLDSRRLPRTLNGLNEYVRKIVQYVWLMKVQDPPMQLLWQRQGDRFDRDRFSEYTQRGPFAGQSVWPALLLHKGGPLVSKGISQGER